jgi:hypothetical protein
MSEGEIYSADHEVAPQIHGGQDTPENLRPMCRRCNSSGGTRGGVATQPQTVAAHPASDFSPTMGFRPQP